MHRSRCGGAYRLRRRGASESAAESSQGGSAEDEEASSNEDEDEDKGASLQIDDIGGAGLDDFDEDFDERGHVQHAPLHRLADHVAALKVAFRRADVDVIQEKTRLSAADKQLLELAAAYEKQLKQLYGLQWATGSPKW